MSETINKVKDWLKKLNKRESSYDKGGVNPRKDWEVILSVTFFTLLILAAVAGYFYIQVKQGSLFGVAGGDIENEVKINKLLLDKTIGDINERRKLFDAVVHGAVIPPDPSL